MNLVDRVNRLSNYSRGYCTSAELANERLDVQPILDFLDYPLSPPIIDFGENNPKKRILEKPLGPIKSIDHDFNYPFQLEPFGTGFCLEVLEHLMNPFLFLETVADAMNEDSTLYLSTPARPQFLWTEHHFCEYTSGRLKGWLFDPLGLSVVKQKQLRIPHDWYFYLTGIRPLFRFFLNRTAIYKIVKRAPVL